MARSAVWYRRPFSIASVARSAIDARIGSLARAHDLLTERNWAGAELGDVVARAVEPFAASQVRHVGPSIQVSPRHALALSMAWDEATYGREYDLDVFNIVAVDDFNFGAMENQGLNIFNSRYILADPDTATDYDYDAIAAVVA